MLEVPDIQAVVVATPSDSHREVTLAALEAGKHVFVEKPLAGTLEDARLIVAAAQRSKLSVQVGFCERFNAALPRGEAGRGGWAARQDPLDPIVAHRALFILRSHLGARRARHGRA